MTQPSTVIVDPEPSPSLSLSVGKTAVPTTLSLAGRNPASDTVTVPPTCDRIARRVRAPSAISSCARGRRPSVGVGRNEPPWPGLIELKPAAEPKKHRNATEWLKLLGELLYERRNESRPILYDLERKARNCLTASRKTTRTLPKCSETRALSRVRFGGWRKRSHPCKDGRTPKTMMSSFWTQLSSSAARMASPPNGR